MKTIIRRQLGKEKIAEGVLHYCCTRENKSHAQSHGKKMKFDADLVIFSLSLEFLLSWVTKKACMKVAG